MNDTAIGFWGFTVQSLLQGLFLALALPSIFHMCRERIRRRKPLNWWILAGIVTLTVAVTLVRQLNPIRHNVADEIRCPAIISLPR